MTSTVDGRAVAIETSGLTKTYTRGARPALDGLNLTVHRGEIFGYLGPNGAGKTTTIKLLLDLIRPTTGSATLLGMNAQRDAVDLHRKIGFMPGELNLWQHYTGRQVIDYLGRVRGGKDETSVKALVQQLDLDLSKTVRSYSSGNRRKIGLVIALMHRPELLILDEPTGGLDPLMQQIFNQMMLDVRAEGRTVFLSSHILSEVQAICDRVGILRDGKLQTVERVTDLTRAQFHWVTVKLRGQAAPALLANVPGVSDVTVDDSALRFKLRGDIDPVLRALSGEYVREIVSQDPSLEEIFLTYYGNGARAHMSAIKSAEVAK